MEDEDYDEKYGTYQYHYGGQHYEVGGEVHGEGETVDSQLILRFDLEQKVT